MFPLALMLKPISTATNGGCVLNIANSMTDKLTIHTGDCRTVLDNIEAASIDTCITSPPYFGLREYDHEFQIGTEATVTEFVNNLCDIMEGVHRVLKTEGTLWVNIGDGYCNTNGYQRSKKGWDRTAREGAQANDRDLRDLLNEGYKVKDVLGVPWRFAFEMQRRGWYLRQDIVWNKPNPMPENVFDRCTKSHEFIFLFSKSKKYYFDLNAIKTASKSGDGTRVNPRSVWTVPVSRFKGAHFATYPPELIEPCVLAGCPPGGTVLDPFAGSGTTAGVAIKHDRRAVLIEANADYVAIIHDRVNEIAGLKNNPLFV